ncbi:MULTISPECIES: MFS transporter [unclassified Streptomyces]|uniref:MFS transporter n=1 Tax=unclassified Streptomyces TaxID=2593676 RepID=UPI000A808C15|nr:MFS transporter [Streptomyces sp. TSRI0107]
MAVWGARMPAVQAAAQLGPGRLAMVLLAAAAGMVVGLQLGGRLAHRYGPARLLVGPAIIFGLSLALLGTCRSLTSLSLVAVVFGIGHGLLDVGANSAAVNLERAYQRRIMSSLHCAYSVGALTGAGLAAITAWAPYHVLFAAIGILTAMAAAAALPLVRSAGHRDAPAQQPSAQRDDSPESRGAPCGCSASWPRPASWGRAPQQTGPQSTCTLFTPPRRSLPSPTPPTARPWSQAVSSVTA